MKKNLFLVFILFLPLWISQSFASTQNQNAFSSKIDKMMQKQHEMMNQMFESFNDDFFSSSNTLKSPSSGELNYSWKEEKNMSSLVIEGNNLDKMDINIKDNAIQLSKNMQKETTNSHANSNFKGYTRSFSSSTQILRLPNNLDHKTANITRDKNKIIVSFKKTSSAQALNYPKKNPVKAPQKKKRFKIKNNPQAPLTEFNGQII